MDTTKIVSFVKENIEPLPDKMYGDLYRVSATLKDGTELPCVVISSAVRWRNLAIKRFDECRHSTNLMSGYEAIVDTFVTKGNRVNDFDLREVRASKFAIPVARLMEIQDETSMSWTAFKAIMRDGKEFDFGTSYHVEFFNMPPGYSAEDIMKIIPAPRFSLPNPSVFRERPFFNCYLPSI